MLFDALVRLLAVSLLGAFGHAGNAVGCGRDKTSGFAVSWS
jgi:hypothetical protein